MDNGKKTIWWRVVEIGVIIVVLVWHWFYIREKDFPKPQEVSEPIEIMAMPIKAQNITVDSPYIGFVTPIEDVAISSYINGYIDEVLVKGGEKVSKDDVLVVIRQDEYKAQLALANAQVLKAQATFENALSYYKRIIKAGPKAISQSNIEDAQTQVLSAEAALEEARANYSVAKINLEYTLIKSPISGVVGNVSLTKGDYVSPASQPLFSIVQYSPIRVVFSITDKEYLQELAGSKDGYKNDKIRLKLSDGSLYAESGKVEYFDNQLDKNTASLAVYADFCNKDDYLISNAYVDVLVEKNFNNVVVIKQNMLTLSPQGNFITVANNGKLMSKKVNLIASSGNDYVLKNDFEKDDMLVLSNVQNIRPEQKIVIKPFDAKGE